MAFQSIGLGTSADDGTGDSLRVGGDKVNDNFSEIYTLLGTGSALTTGLSTTASVVTLSSAVGTFTTLTPAASDGTALGSASLEFSDLFLADASTIKFGADQDVILTHVADTGLLLNAAMKIQFRDAAIHISSTADGDLSIAADDEIDLTSTLIDINGNVEISGTLAQADTVTMATNKKIQFRDTAIHISSTADGDLSIAADDEIDITSTLIDINGNVDISGTALITVVTTHGDDVVSDTDSTDDLGTTGVRWANLFVDAITATDQITATGFTGTLDGILGSGAAAAASVTTLTATGTVTMTGKAINHAVHTEAAHATTSNIWSGGNTCLLSGSVVTFTDVADAPQAGAVRFVVANAAHIITDNAALEVDGNENYTCAVNDVLMFTAKTTSTFRVSVIAHGDNATGGGGGESGFVENNATISADVSIVSGNNAISAGPVTVANGVTLTIPNGSRYVIV